MNRQLKQAACTWSCGPTCPLRYLTDRLVDVRPHDGGPGTRRNDAYRDGIGWASEAAHDALETRLRGPIRPIDVPAGQARLRRVAGIDQHDWHPDTRRLVLHEGAQLSECPVGVARSLPPSNRDALADALKVFQGNSATGVFGGAHQCLADAVVRVALEARLLSAQGLELAFGRPCLATLQIASAVGEGATLLFDARAGIDNGIGVGGDVDDAQVDAQKVVHVNRRNIGHLERGIQVEHAISQDEVGLTTQTAATRLLIRTEAARHQGSTVERQDADVLQALPRHDALVV